MRRTFECHRRDLLRSGLLAAAAVLAAAGVSAAPPDIVVGAPHSLPGGFGEAAGRSSPACGSL